MGPRRTGLRARATLAMCCLGSLAAVWSCRDPTEVTLVITTNVPCGKLTGGTTIAVGSPTDFDTKPPIAESTPTQCIQGQHGAPSSIGTFVVIPDPGAGSDEPFAVRVVTGVNDTAENCAKKNNFGPCIVERRSLSFIPHTPLTVPILMEQDCEGVTCDPSTTCVLGQCTNIALKCSAGMDCTLEPVDGGSDGPEDASSEAPGDGQGADHEFVDGATDSELPDSTTPDQAADVSPDVTVEDVASETIATMEAAGSEPGMDAPAADVAAEAPSSTDASVDVGPDVGPDVAADAGVDAAVDAVADTSPNDASDGAPPADAGAADGACIPAGTTTVACGTGTCLAGDVCCVDYNSIFPSTTETCTATSACTPGANTVTGDTISSLACRNQGDCPTGHVCCAVPVNSGVSATCVTTGSCPHMFSGQTQLCHGGCECGALTCKNTNCTSTVGEFLLTCGGTCP